MYNIINRSCCMPANIHLKHNPAYFTKPGFDCNPAEYKATFTPYVDISEDKEAFYIEFELPGVQKNEVKVQVNDERILIVEGKKIRITEENQKTLRKEIKSGEFSRSFRLPVNVDAEAIHARYENGVLILTLPKVQPKETPVEIK